VDFPLEVVAVRRRGKIFSYPLPRIEPQGLSGVELSSISENPFHAQFMQMAKIIIERAFSSYC
jgi:hypothetical protein